MKTTRRSFFGTLTAGAVCLAFGWESPVRQLPIAFSTIGCPAWDLNKILDFAAANGFAAIELRGLEGNLDLPSHLAFAADHIEPTRQSIAAHKLRIACVSSSTDTAESDLEKRTKGFADARRFIDLAQMLQAPYVRVFGKSEDSDHPTTPSADLKELVITGLHELGTYAGSRNVTVLIESHDDFTSVAVLKELLERADSPHVGLLWDAFHTFATSNESPEVTVNALMPWIHHIHLKDAVGAGPNRKYVLTGRGNIPVREQIDVLHHAGYKGYYCFEWEKVWHPDLEDPEIAISDYARFMRENFANSKS